MPTQIAKLPSQTLTERITAFAKSLPDDEGWTITEVMEKMKASQSLVTQIARKIGIKRDATWYLVNPKTRAKYAD